MEHERPLIDLDWDDDAAEGGGVVYNSIFYSSNDGNTSTDNNDHINNNNNSKSLVVVDNTPTAGLGEFSGKGGGKGVFRLPDRGAVHPLRPPCVELRPRPLRETQFGSFLRTIVSTPSHLCAASQNSVRFFDYAHLYNSSSSAAAAAPFTESVRGIPPTLCMVSDDSTHCVWSGHQDGRIRCWNSNSQPDFDESFSWQAHRLPVVSLLFTSFGDLWSCSEGGIIKIWPWEAIRKGLSLSTSESQHMSSLTVERSYITLTPPPASTYTLPSDIRHLLSHRSSAKIWTASATTFALWDARTRELLKVFNIDGQVENRPDTSSNLQDFSMELISGLKKDKTQSPFGFFQRSRNAIIGAADAVRRAAAKGNFCDDNQKTEAMVATIDGMIWTGCANGLLIQWDGHGNRVQEFHYHFSPILCFCTFGPRLWVGYGSGTIHVLDLDGNIIGRWVAHRSPVIKMSVGGGYVFSLANHGGIRGWNVSTPGPIDDILRSQLSAKEILYRRIENVKILTGTWNVGQERASQDSLISWLGSTASDVDIVVVGLQEVEMGAGFLALSAAKETVGLEGSSIGQWWLDAIGKILDEGATFERVGSRQLAGLLISVWVRTNLKAYVGDVDAAAVPCGFGRAIGNKGAVGLRIRVYDRLMCFVNCHFAAHLEAVNRRNADFDRVYRNMTFSRPSNVVNAAAAGASFAVQMIPGTNTTGSNSIEGIPDLSEADMVVFLGDMNYRLKEISFDEARDFIAQRCFDCLKEKDQLRAEMEAGNVFQGMWEADVKFPPTYKFEKQQPGLGGYDIGEKRIPAWCDRVLYRDSRAWCDRVLYRDSRSTLTSECSLACPVVSLITQYESCMDVIDSDHKPVRCKFSVDIARVDESIRRREFGEIIRTNQSIKYMFEKLNKVPETVVSTNNILLQNQDTSILRITNKCGKNDAFFEIVCVGQSTVRDDCQSSEQSSRGSFGFPRWLQVNPATGIIKPEHIAEISVHHEQFETVEEFVDGVPQNWWCEDSRDKEVKLLVKVRGSFSTTTRNHPIRLRHCFSAKTKKADNTGDRPNQQIPGSLLQRADHQRLSGSYDVVDDLRKLRGP